MGNHKIINKNLRLWLEEVYDALFREDDSIISAELLKLFKNKSTSNKQISLEVYNKEWKELMNQFPITASKGELATLKFLFLCYYPSRTMELWDKFKLGEMTQAKTRIEAFIYGLFKEDYHENVDKAWELAFNGMPTLFYHDGDGLPNPNIQKKKVQHPTDLPSTSGKLTYSKPSKGEEDAKSDTEDDMNNEDLDKTCIQISSPARIIKNKGEETFSSDIYPFLLTQPPIDCFGRWFNIEALKCAINAEKGGPYIAKLLELPPQEAWRVCDKEIFIPFFDRMRSYHVKNNEPSPLTTEIISGIESIINKKSSTEKDSGDLTNSMKVVVQKLNEIQIQLTSQGKITPTIGIVAPPYQPQPSSSQISNVSVVKKSRFK